MPCSGEDSCGKRELFLGRNLGDGSHDWVMSIGENMCQVFQKEKVSVSASEVRFTQK